MEHKFLAGRKYSFILHLCKRWKRKKFSQSCLQWFYDMCPFLQKRSFWILMCFWVLHPFCWLNAGFTTGIDGKKMEMIYLPEKTQITGKTKKACVDCTRVPKSSLKPWVIFEEGNPGMTFGSTAELLIIDHTRKMITAKHWGTEITVILYTAEKGFPFLRGRRGERMERCTFSAICSRHLEK